MAINNLISFNENRSCIEIRFVSLHLEEAFRLMKTEVVLKFVFFSNIFPIYLCLMKTEVVLKFVYSVYLYNIYMFNENRSCIEIYIHLLSS